MAKAEERIERIVEKCLNEGKEKLEREVLTNSAGLISFGFLLGALFAYLSFFPLIVGIVIGIYLSKSKLRITDYLSLKFINLWLRGQTLIGISSATSFRSSFGPSSALLSPSAASDSSTKF